MREIIAQELLKIAKLVSARNADHMTDALFNIDQAVGHLNVLVAEMNKNPFRDRHLVGLIENEIEALQGEASMLTRLRTKVV